MPRGFFLTFEGLDGSGKSTQLRKLHEWLVRRGEDVVATRQPGGTRLGDRIRSLLLDSRRNPIDPRAELGLMFSDRAQAIAEVIREGKSVTYDMKPSRDDPTAVGTSEVADAIIDQMGARAVIPLGAFLTAIGALLFGTGNLAAAYVGRFLQGAGGV